MKKTRRVLLFVPGNNPAMLRSATIINADTLLLDLEDAVAPAEKDSARYLIRNACAILPFGNKEVAVRINPLYSPWGYKDLEIMAAVPQINTILLPKANPEYVREVDRVLEGTEKEIICLIESAYGLQTAYETAKASKRVNGLILGAEDLAADMNFERTAEGAEIFFARNTVVLAAHAAKVQPIDTPYVAIDDFEGARLDTLKAKAMGFTAKAAISPMHVSIFKEVFAPTAGEILQAERIVQAAEEAESKGLGAVQLDGKMVDRPIVLRAQRILELAKEVAKR